MRIFSMAFGMLGSLLGFATGGTYLLYTYFMVNNHLGVEGENAFIYQVPSPIYDTSFWILGAIALVISLMGFMGSLLSLYKPKASSIIMLTTSVVGLGIIMIGYLISSLTLFIGALIAILEHRRTKFSLNLREVLLPAPNLHASFYEQDHNEANEKKESFSSNSDTIPSNSDKAKFSSGKKKDKVDAINIEESDGTDE